MIFVKTEQEIDLMREPCRIMRDALDYLGNQLKAGMTTADVNALRSSMRRRSASPGVNREKGASRCRSAQWKTFNGIVFRILSPAF